MDAFLVIEIERIEVEDQALARRRTVARLAEDACREAARDGIACELARVGDDLCLTWRPSRGVPPKVDEGGFDWDDPQDGPDPVLIEAFAGGGGGGAVTVEPDAGFGGAGTAAAPAPNPPDPILPGSARALAGTNLPRLWTAEEDARAVDMAVRLRLDGTRSPMALAGVIGPALGRPLDGTAWRLRKVLAERIADGVRLARQAPPAVVPDQEVPDQEVADDAVAALPEWDFNPLRPPGDSARPALVVEGAAAAALDQPAPWFAAAPDDALTRHLLGLPRGGVWTWDRDSEVAELIGLGGWTLAAIALEMKLSGRDITNRFDAMTGWDRNTRLRAFGRDAVIARMALLSGLSAAGDAAE